MDGGKLMNAPWKLGYAVILSGWIKRQGLKEKGRYYHVALACRQPARVLS